MDKHIGDRIRERRKALGLSQEQFGKRVGRTKGAVSQWESGLVRPDRDSLLALAKALGCSTGWLMDGSASAEDFRGGYQVESNVAPGPAVSGMAPELSWVQAGAWTEVCQLDPDPEATTWHPRIAGGEQTFVLRVVGESMLPDYPPGRLIFVDPERAAGSGDDVIAVLTDTDEATFKRLVEEPGSGRMLKALNPAWRDPYLPINGNCRIIGVVVADMRLR